VLDESTSPMGRNDETNSWRGISDEIQSQSGIESKTQSQKSNAINQSRMILIRIYSRTMTEDDGNDPV
jgi:hypothetical protein